MDYGISCWKCCCSKVVPARAIGFAYSRSATDSTGDRQADTAAEDAAEAHANRREKLVGESEGSRSGAEENNVSSNDGLELQLLRHITTFLQKRGRNYSSWKMTTGVKKASRRRTQH